APAGHAALTRPHQRGALALPGGAFVHGLAADRGRAVHHEDETRQRRELEFDILGAGEEIFVKPKHGMHWGLRRVSLVNIRFLFSPPASRYHGGRSRPAI